MSGVLTSIPDSPQVKAIAAVLDILRTDPDILTFGVTVWAPEGDRKKLPPFYPEYGELPVVRLLQWTFPARWLDEGHHKGELTLMFEVIVPGTHYADEFKVVDLVRAALFPSAFSARWTTVKGKLAFDGAPTRDRFQTLGAQTKAIGTDHYARVAQVAYTMIFDVPT